MTPGGGVSFYNFPLFRANPHLTLRVRQATAHVTPFYSAHPASPQPYPSSPASIVRSLPPRFCLPVLPGMLIPGRAAVESVNSWREGLRGARTGTRWAVIGPWYQDRPLGLTILVLNINVITKVKLEFCLTTHSWFYSLS